MSPYTNGKPRNGSIPVIPWHNIDGLDSARRTDPDMGDSSTNKESIVHIQSETVDDVVRDFLRIRAYALPEHVHIPPVLLGRPAHTPVPLEEEGLDRRAQLVQLGLRSEILGIFGNEPSPDPVLDRKSVV